MPPRVLPGLLVIMTLLLAALVAGCAGTSSPVPTPQPATSITALTGYPIAEKAATSAYHDAIFIGALGSVARNRTGMPAVIDGRSASWLYSFVSPSAKKEVAIWVDSDMTSRVESAGANLTVSSDTMALLPGIRPVSDCKVDSDSAVGIALPLYQEKFGGNPLSAIYILSNTRNFTGAQLFYWGIMFTGGANQSVFNSSNQVAIDSLTVLIDPTTGTVMPNSLILPPS
jgi:hypothetical protein